MIFPLFKQVTAFSLLLLPLTSIAQLPLAPIGSRAAALANITTVDTSVWVAVNNPANLGMQRNIQIGVSYEQRFAMREMGVSSLATTFPLLGNGIGISLSNLGFSTYGESRFGFSTGRKISNYISVGAGVDAHLLRFPEDYQNLFAVTGTIGVWARPLEKLTLGLQVFNITFSKWNDAARSPLPVVFALGVSYAVAEPVALFAELSKDVNEPLRVKFGSEFSILRALYLRAGVISEPFETHFGIGYSYKNFQFDAAFAWHPVLGYTPQAGISIKL